MPNGKMDARPSGFERFVCFWVTFIFWGSFVGLLYLMWSAVQRPADAWGDGIALALAGIGAAAFFLLGWASLYAATRRFGGHDD